MKNRTEISAAEDIQRKSLKTSEKWGDIDDPLLEWFRNMRSSGKHIDGKLLESAMRKMLVRAGYGNYEGELESWIKRWWARHGITFKSVVGESASVPEFSSWLESARKLVDEFPVNNVFNADETALFYRLQSSKTFTLKTEKQMFGKKLDKARVTLLVACNAVGEKLPLLCLGKAKNPRWPKVFGKRATAPVSYRGSSKGWMTRRIFEEWLVNLNVEMKRQKRKILLFLDNCSAHRPEDSFNLSHVWMEFLPANTTSKLQPCDQGVIRSLKAKFRKLLGKFLLCNEPRDVDLYKALHLARHSWSQVASNTIVNSWRKSGLLAKNDKVSENEEREDSALEATEEIHERLILDP